METSERQFVLDQLASSEARLLGLVEGLTPAQWNFHETPERWSIAENIEHVIVVETRISKGVARVLEGPAEPGKRPLVAGKDEIVRNVATARQTKLNAPEAVRPTGKWTDTTELVEELRKTRARTVAFAQEMQDNMRDHFMPHMALGDLDCYQWMVVLSQHGARHALQIEEIKANPAYPTH